MSLKCLMPLRADRVNEQLVQSKRRRVNEQTRDWREF